MTRFCEQCNKNDHESCMMLFNCKWICRVCQGEEKQISPMSSYEYFQLAKYYSGFNWPNLIKEEYKKIYGDKMQEKESCAMLEILKMRTERHERQIMEMDIQLQMLRDGKWFKNKDEECQEIAQEENEFLENLQEFYQKLSIWAEVSPVAENIFNEFERLFESLIEDGKE